MNAVVCLMGCLMLCSCGGGDFMTSLKQAVKMEPTKVWLQKVYFEVDEKLNNDAPVTVNLLIFYDEKMMGEIAKMTASQYFQKLDQIKRDAADNIDFYTYEIVPGQTLPPQVVKPSRSDGKGIIVFGRYTTPGDHRQAIGPDREVTLQTGAKDFAVIPVKNPSA